MPDLVLVDGGKGQLSTAKQVLDSLELTQLPVIGLAKRMEEVFVPGDPDPWILPKTSPALKLLQQVRDEAHRFAIEHHRALRGKQLTVSKLDTIPGIGPSRRTALLKHFRSLKRLKAAPMEEIAAVPGISEQLAKQILPYLTHL